MDKKRKRVAPLAKTSLGSGLAAETTEVLTDGLMDNALDEIFGNSNDVKLGEPLSSQNSEKTKNICVDLGDCSTLLPSVKLATARFDESSKLPIPEKNSALASKPLTNMVDFKKAVTKLDKFGGSIMFSSKELEADSVLGLRFLKRSITTSSIKQLTAGLEFVSLVAALKHVESKNFFTCGVLTECTVLRKTGVMIGLSDLAMEPCCIRVLLFGTASSAFGSPSFPNGSILILLNPRKGKPYNGKESLIVNNEKQIVMAGSSRDYGVCGARTKAGGACKNVVNLNLCRYCSYHAMSQFKQKQVGKNLRSVATGNGLLPEKHRPVTINSMQWLGPTKNKLTLIPGKRNVTMAQKDHDTLARLNSPKRSFSQLITKENISKPKLSSSPPISNTNKFSIATDSLVPLSPLNNPVADKWMNCGFYDALKSSNERKKISTAKKRALEFAKQSGGISQLEKKPKKDIAINVDLGKKTKDESNGLTDEFFLLMKEKPSNPALLKEAESEEMDKRFDRLKVIEEIGEKLSNTHEVPVRAIRCLVCQKNFCKLPLQCTKSNHKCRVVQTTKRFYQCGSCKNRTSTLEILPTVECSKCGKWVWQKAGIASEKVCSTAQKLSVRGLEEKFLGSVVTDANLSLLVPDDK